MTTTTGSESLRSITFVYKGRRREGSKTFHVYSQVVKTDGVYREPEGAKHLWRDVKLKNSYIGGVLNLFYTPDDESRCYVSGANGPVFVEWAEDAEGIKNRQRWRFLDRSVDTIKRAMSEGGKKRKEVIDACLTPIANAMKETDEAGRKAIISDVIDLLYTWYKK